MVLDKYGLPNSAISIWLSLNCTQTVDPAFIIISVRIVKNDQVMVSVSEGRVGRLESREGLNVVHGVGLNPNALRKFEP